MKLLRILTLLWICVLSLAACGSSQAPNEIVVQRFFGDCRALIGDSTDVEGAEGECGIITTLLNRFAAEHPDLKLDVSPVSWPGYDQLSAQFAAGNPPDVVIMHVSVIADYQSRGLLEPIGDALRAAGVDPLGFTEASLKGVSKAGDIYGLPFDTWASLWHINLNYFRQAGLMRDGEPILPTSPQELSQQARQFRERVGKPYFVQSMVKERAMYARNLYTYLAQQNVDAFANPRRISLQTPEARRVVEIFKAIYDEGMTTRGQDYPAATNGFLNGDGGVYMAGTWVLGNFDSESRTPGRPLSGGYTAVTYPQLFPGKDATFADGHVWVVPVRERTTQQRAAVYKLLKFLADNDYHWARTGHLPAFSEIVASERFKALPHRRTIAKLTTVGTPLPGAVQRQFAIQEIISEEIDAAITGLKSIDAALADAEHRVNDLLSHIPWEIPDVSTPDHTTSRAHGSSIAPSLLPR